MKIWKINSFFKKSAYCIGYSCYKCKHMFKCHGARKRNAIKRAIHKRLARNIFTVKDDFLDGLTNKSHIGLRD